MAEYGSLRAGIKLDKLCNVQVWKEGVSKEDHDKLVDEAVAERNAMTGMTRVLQYYSEPPLPGELFPAEPSGKINDVASRDLIRHYADGIGDANPLWRDQGYAQKSRWGGITAPGPFLHCIAWGTMGYPRGAPPGTNWTFLKPIREWDNFTVYDTLGGLEEVTKPGKPRQFIERNYRTYVNQRGETAGIAERLMIQMVRPEKSKIHPAIAGLKRYKYTEEEIVAIEKAYGEEERRGKLPRYWDHVVEGETLKPVVKGPITLMDMVAFAQAGFQYPAHGIYLEMRKRVPGHDIVDPATGVTNDTGSMHYVDQLASLGISPVATNYGEQTVSWAGHMITNWMGDDGFLRKLNTRLFQYIPLGDTLWYKGKVAKKYEEEGQFLVDIDFEVINQYNVKVAGGNATVQLMGIGKGRKNIYPE